MHRLSLPQFIHSFIHSRIYEVPLQEIYSEAPPAQPQRYNQSYYNIIPFNIPIPFFYSEQNV